MSGSIASKPETTSPLALGQLATLACVLEATAPKPGNVHRGADFEDMTYLDMITSAIAIGPLLERTNDLGVGKTIQRAVSITHQLVGRNTNLGTLILLAPLSAAAIATPTNLRSGTAKVLDNLCANDASAVYAAIRLASPGGLGNVEVADVHGDAPTDLRAAMKSAQDRDLVARQYVNDYEQIFELVLPAITTSIADGQRFLDAIVFAHLKTLASHPDSLIARKCGEATAREASDRASHVLTSGPIAGDSYHESLRNFDFWLRTDGHRRNPGTTADLIAAALFAGLITGDLVVNPET